MIFVALIEDNYLAREGMSTLLERLPDIRVVCGGGDDLSELRDVEPEVVLLDIDLPNGGSLRLAERVRAELPGAKIVAMDSAAIQEGLVRWVQLGVSGFLLKDATVEDLARTIRSVARGNKVLPPAMAETLFKQMADDSVDGVRDPFQITGITPREQEVIGLIAEGLSNKAIAARLHIAIATVKSHVRNIMEKLSLRTRLQIAVLAHRNRSLHIRRTE